MQEHPNDRLLTAFVSSRFGRGRRPVTFRPKRGRSVSGVITLSGGRRIFLKQDASDGSALLEREAAVLAALSANSGPPFAPRLIDFDAEQRLLIAEFIDGYSPLDRQLRRTSLRDFASSAAAGLALARLHRLALEIPGIAMQSVSFPLAEIAPLTPEDIAARPAGHAQLAAVLHQSRHAVQKLASRWQPSRFIHGDFKADNLLFRMDPRLKDQPSVIIVDWEMAGFGDPLWDAGSFIGSLLLAWMQAIAPSVADAEALAGQDANAVRRQIGYFLLTYRHMAPEIFEATESFAVTVFQYAGIFMLHRVAVNLEIIGQLDRAAALLLAFARSLLNNPEAAMATLLAGMKL